jgi:hypothetical protein
MIRLKGGVISTKHPPCIRHCIISVTLALLIVHHKYIQAHEKYPKYNSGIIRIIILLIIYNYMHLSNRNFLKNCFKFYL